MNTQPQAIDLQFLSTPDHHQIAYALIGDPTLTPVLFLHGGPGSHANPDDAKRFDLDRHCVVMFDQRGCGRSTPTGDIANNTTQHLINDIEQLRQQLGIKRWKVYGGSWGAALALEYVKQYKRYVIAVILRGSFPARQQDLTWFIEADGIARQHPQEYLALHAALLPEPDEPLTSSLYRRLQPTEDKASAYQAALAWDHWEATVMGLAKTAPEDDPQQQQKRIASKLIYAHYCHHQFFLGDTGVLPKLDQLRGLPVTLLHGRHDQVCPLSAAEALAAAIPGSELIVVEAGHILQSTIMSQALQQALTKT